MNGYSVNEEVLDIDVDENEAVRNDEELDPKMVKEGRREEVEFMVKKLDMFEFGTFGGGHEQRRKDADDDEVGGGLEE